MTSSLQCFQSEIWIITMILRLETNYSHTLSFELKGEKKVWEIWWFEIDVKTTQYLVYCYLLTFFSKPSTFSSPLWLAYSSSRFTSSSSPSIFLNLLLCQCQVKILKWIYKVTSNTVTYYKYLLLFLPHSFRYQWHHTPEYWDIVGLLMCWVPGFWWFCSSLCIVVLYSSAWIYPLLPKTFKTSKIKVF